MLILTDVDWETGRPYLESTLEVPYAEVASHVVTGSALSSYLARCPAALAP